MALFVPPPKSLGFLNFTTLTCTWFGAGLLRPAPGTWGSVLAIPFGYLILAYAGWPALTVAAFLLLLIGIWESGLFANAANDSDPSSVVVDEVVGMWFALLAAPLTWPAFVTAFLLFRFFDIVKPWPVGWADKKLKGGLGIMLDDVFAGIYTTCLIVVARFADWL